MPRPFAALIRLTQYKLESIATEVERLNAQVAEANRKRDALVKDRDAYQARARLMTEDSIPVSAVSNAGVYLARLDQAILKADAELEYWKASVEGARSKWREAERECDKFDSVANRQLAVEMAKARRAEQKEQDEFAVRPAGSSSLTA